MLLPVPLLSLLPPTQSLPTVSGLSDLLTILKVPYHLVSWGLCTLKGWSGGRHILSYLSPSASWEALETTPQLWFRHLQLSHNSGALKETTLVYFSQCYSTWTTVFFPLEFLYLAYWNTSYFVFKLVFWRGAEYTTPRYAHLAYWLF